MPTTAPAPPPHLLWDIFCRVIDNFGDIGVCWRLCSDLAGRGHEIRLWVDDASALTWMAPEALEGRVPGVRVLPWSDSANATCVAALRHADVWVETFGCEIAPEFIAAYANSMRAEDQNDSKFPAWINLEYLSAEGFARRCHRLASPVMHGPAKGATKFFFYPGFTPDSGSLIREPNLLQRQQTFDAAGWLLAQGVPHSAGPVVSLFCYEPRALPALLRQLADSPKPCTLLVTPGRATGALQAALAAHPSLRGATRIHLLPHLSQTDFDHLLWASDFNFVRGEDSLVRAMWAGKPFAWHIYPQDDDAHHAKLDAFLDWMQATPSLRDLHAAWNATRVDANLPPILQEMPGWARLASQARDRLLEMPDLSTQLIDFVAEKR
ncbi:elongation factor P maturation arginine rhamnosyltransferase EarP [Curvibacter sp. APW13]|uniref:elongation factor P maturation arginine rhamnosyltransferase EarP n=1 Tax=Curvibacter sp. APW13 TaxID=3077236 RepID=UPI0028DE0CF7|nr:elongation factor P maturation arginine rhamnosyltransferase EarP [Curvibacter sp. APW13]MDT8992149.1 elongation factor P maturation arginine rhamnosyltransferase EarP [Curvibacter sp. APW13]